MFNGGYVGYTGDKKREYDRNWFANRRKEFFTDKKCTECDSTQNLELHHINPKDKIANSIWSWSKERQIEEIKKCVILCNKCHKIKTIEQKKRPITHGTVTGYNKWYCRCGKCKKFYAEWRKIHQTARKVKIQPNS